MPRPPRLAWDSSCFIALLNRAPTEDPACLTALAAKMEEMVSGRIRIVASRVIEIEVRPGDLMRTTEFHQQLRACPYFESFGESQVIRNLANELQARLQASGRRGHYADLIHISTAITARAQEFWTTDKKLVSWTSAGIISEIEICLPYLVQGRFEF